MPPGRPWRQEKYRRLQAIAQKRGGEILSREYVDASTPLRFRCARGHVFEALPTNVDSGGTWCPQCGRAETARKRVAHSWRELEKAVASRGGEVLTPPEKYTGTTGHVELRCGHGHRWSPLAMSVIQGSWCPGCAKKGRRPLEPGKLRALFEKAGYTLLEEPVRGLRGRYRAKDAKGETRELYGWYVKQIAEGR